MKYIRNITISKKFANHNEFSCFQRTDRWTEVRKEANKERMVIMKYCIKEAGRK